jgi:hypothetical protein
VILATGDACRPTSRREPTVRRASGSAEPRTSFAATTQPARPPSPARERRNRTATHHSPLTPAKASVRTAR